MNKSGFIYLFAFAMCFCVNAGAQNESEKTADFPLEWFKTDFVTIQGRIEGGKILQGDFNDTIMLSSTTPLGMSFEYQKTHPSLHQIPVSSDGTFTARILLDGPQQTGLIVWKAGVIIPVILLPGDQLTVEVKNLGQPDQQVTYGGASAQYANYLHNLPDLPIWSEPKSPSNYSEVVMAEYDKLMQQTESIATQHQFSSVERSLLSAYVSMFVGYKYVCYMIAQDWDHHRMPDYDFLRHLPFGQRCAMVVPSGISVVSRLEHTLFKDIHSQYFASTHTFAERMGQKQEKCAARMAELSGMHTGETNYILEAYLLYSLNDVVDYNRRSSEPVDVSIRHAVAQQQLNSIHFPFYKEMGMRVLSEIDGPALGMSPK